MPSRSRLPALVLAAVVAQPAAVVAQGSDVGAYVLDLAPAVLALVPTVLDLAATVNDTGGTAEDISAAAQATLERSGDIEVRRAGDDFILSVASDVLFGFDSADLPRRPA